MALNDVTRDELQGVIAQLKESLNNHQQWHGSLIRTLVCKLPGDKHDLSDAAHAECRFGQWYYSTAPEKLRKHPGFIALGDEHQRMHHMAKLLLTRGECRQPHFPPRLRQLCQCAGPAAA